MSNINSIDLLKELLFEKDLERSIGEYFKEGDKFSLSHKSKITGCKIDYNAEQLMSLFAIESEIEIANILKMKFGNRVRHIGGTALEDIAIEGTNYVFNVKASNSETVSTLKLFQSSSANKIDNLKYRFILVNYNLSEDRSEIEFGKVLVFNYEYIKNAISEYKGGIHILKTKIDEYIHARDEYINGNVQSFNMISKERVNKKPSLTIEQLKRFIVKQGEFSIDSIRSHYEKKYNISSLSSFFNKMIEEKFIEFKDGNYSVIQEENNMPVVIEKSVKTKFQITTEAYRRFLENKSHKSEKDFRDFLKEQYGISSKLSSTYIGKIKKLRV